MSPPPLEGVRILDVATIFAGPLAATLLGDFGADVIKVEHPRGDPLRALGHSKNGAGLWAKSVNRNKRMLTLNLSDPDGQEILLQLVRTADVLIENFRPGTLERWNLGPERLQVDNPRLIMLRTTAFGQFGPYANRPGFGTLAESMSGFAAITGQPYGPPTLIIEPILTILGAQVSVFDQLGIVQQRAGNRSTNNAPRNTYRTRDGKWVALSTSASTIAARVMRLVGHPEVVDEPWFATARGTHADELDGWVASWILERDQAEVIRAFEEAEAAVAPIYDASDHLDDPQFAALETYVTVPDEELGPLKMQNVLFRMLGTPGKVRWSGRRVGQDTDTVLGELGLPAERIADLRARGVV